MVAAATYVEDHDFTPFDALHLVESDGDTVVSSDGGQLSNAPPGEMLRGTVQLLLEEGFSESDVRTLFVDTFVLWRLWVFWRTVLGPTGRRSKRIEPPS